MIPTAAAAAAVAAASQSSPANSRAILACKSILEMSVSTTTTLLLNILIHTPGALPDPGSLVFRSSLCIQQNSFVARRHNQDLDLHLYVQLYFHLNPMI
jgi:hypothetical protein